MIQSSLKHQSVWWALAFLVLQSNNINHYFRISLICQDKKKKLLLIRMHVSYCLTLLLNLRVLTKNKWKNKKADNVIDEQRWDADESRDLTWLSVNFVYWIKRKTKNKKNKDYFNCNCASYVFACANVCVSLVYSCKYGRAHLYYYTHYY